MAVNEQYYTILTSYGKQALANAQASGTAVNLVEFAVGDGNGSYYAPNETQTALKNEVYRASINRITTDPDNPNWIVIEGIIPADQGGFTIREIGIFDDQNNLVAIGNYPETYKPVLSQGSGNDMYIRFIMEVENVDSVQLKIDPAIVLASRKYVDDEITAHDTSSTAHADIRTEIDNIKNGNTTVGNADKLDGFDASALQKTYSKITVETTFPTSPNYGDLIWRQDLLKLYKYENEWVEIDWQSIVRSTPDYHFGNLRINAEKLEISPDGINWYECIPAVGVDTIEIGTIDNTNYQYLYFVAPGTQVIIKNANHIPIVYTSRTSPIYQGIFYSLQAGLLGSLGGLYPSNIQISDGWFMYLHASSTGSTVASSLSNLNYFPVIDTDQNGEMWGQFSIKIRPDLVCHSEFLGQGSQGNVLIMSGKGTASSVSYWLGTWVNSDGTNIVVDNLSLVRRS
ncbi:MAG: hypothetical protein DSY47_00110 [Hydrogenothermus sp.]|nr:MAG: hypothetical protein DSY47_00110 [Hydrogenothermus sp.]